MRYIELNPVRAGIVPRPGQYRWSSHAANAWGEDNGILKPHEEYVNLGPTLPRRQEAYRSLFDAELAPDELERIRDCTQSGTPMGSERFKERIERTLSRKVGSGRRGRPAKTRVLDLAS